MQKPQLGIAAVRLSLGSASAAVNQFVQNSILHYIGSCLLNFFCFSCIIIYFNLHNYFLNNFNNFHYC